ncbi:hypothetical protein TWF730_000091 [Orbilia blumenaviensis]|uniref:Thioredoxin n=1 Tax=Orbilia blumenaviensis TaxID=1796055 RepID=A0AAV9VNQ6_9PEZI
MTDHAYIDVENLTQFNEIINQEKYTAVDFYTTWCPPCKAFAPVFAKYAEELRDVNFVKVDIEAAVDVGKEYEITAVPTIMIFRNGKVVEGYEDLNPPELKPTLKALLGEA